jgi:hypothetical protein
VSACRSCGADLPERQRAQEGALTMGNRDQRRTIRKLTEWRRMLRAVKGQRRARELGHRWPRDRHYGAFGWLPTDPRSR